MGGKVFREILRNIKKSTSLKSKANKKLKKAVEEKSDPVEVNGNANANTKANEDNNNYPIKKSGSGLRRNLDGKQKGLKVKSGVLKCSWKENCPQVSILNDVLRIENVEHRTVMEMTGDQDNIEIGGFQMSTQCVTEGDGRKSYCLAINSKLLNLATFEIEVAKDGTVILKGRKLRETKEGQLKILTAPQVQSKDIVIDALENNRTVWIRIYYETVAGPLLDQVSQHSIVDYSKNFKANDSDRTNNNLEDQSELELEMDGSNFSSNNNNKNNTNLFQTAQLNSVK